MAAVKNNFLIKTARPIHTDYFGPNKTWRGFILMPLFAVLGCGLYYSLQDLTSLHSSFYIAQNQIIPLGILLGLAYILFELPNSLLKRKLSIPAGEKSEKFPYFFIVLDQVDSVIGCLFIYLFYFELTPVLIVLILLASPLIHLFINSLLYVCNLRKSPF
jgi:CDP-diacylglycerol--serine O-phosphatidyltransferase